MAAEARAVTRATRGAHDRTAAAAWEADATPRVTPSPARRRPGAGPPLGDLVPSQALRPGETTPSFQALRPEETPPSSGALGRGHNLEFPPSSLVAPPSVGPAGNRES